MKFISIILNYFGVAPNSHHVRADASVILAHSAGFCFVPAIPDMQLAFAPVLVMRWQMEMSFSATAISV